MNSQVQAHLIKLLDDVQSTSAGAPIFVCWIGGDSIPRAACHPGRVGGGASGMEQLAMLAAMSEMLSSAADAAIASMAAAVGEPEDHLRLAYLNMKDKARGSGYRIVEGM